MDKPAEVSLQGNLFRIEVPDWLELRHRKITRSYGDL
jgi:hypothetical protein